MGEWAIGQVMDGIAAPVPLAHFLTFLYHASIDLRFLANCSSTGTSTAKNIMVAAVNSCSVQALHRCVNALR